jgi:hypothetical protein
MLGNSAGKEKPIIFINISKNVNEHYLKVTSQRFVASCHSRKSGNPGDEGLGTGCSPMRA